MSVPAYAEYKNSGVPWLGAVPSHWDLTRVGAKFWERREKVSDADYPALSVTKNGIVPQLDTAAKTDDNDNRKCVLAGDFVINSRSDRNGSSGLSNLDGSVSLINTVIRAYDGMDGQFIHHLFRSVSFQKEYYRFGKGIVADLWSTNYGEMKAICLAVPPLTEQQGIATFLDRETAKIDVLVAEQERLIGLLKEKRQAVISHAVTKGLNPNAPMKNSGIEWLGEIPAHWDVVKGSMIGRLFSTAQVSEDQVSEVGSIPFLKVASLSADGMQIQHWNWFVDGTFASDSLPSEFIVFPKRGAAIFGNKVNVVQCSALIDPNLMGWSIDENASTFFIAFALKARCIAELADVSTVPQINNKHIAPERFPLPPRTEQEEIVLFLEHALGGYDDLVSDAQSAITLLQERRAAMISATVTGKIDVRGAVAADPSLEVA